MLKYLAIGFFMSVGWYLGKAALRMITEKLLAKLQNIRES